MYTYRDYLIACEWLKLDFKDTKVLFPRNFDEMHENYTKQYFNHHQVMKEKSINDRMLEVAEKYKIFETKTDKYSIFIARSWNDLCNESKHLNHCVGRMYYDELQANEESLICFLRLTSNPTIPYVTIEFDLYNKEVVQCYGYNNSLITEIDEFVINWEKNCKKLMIENKELNPTI